MSVFIRHLLVQLETPDAIRGRVSAVSSMFIGASNELGEFESGIMARWLGIVRSVVIGGAATLVVVATYLKLFPQLRMMDRFPQLAPSNEPRPAKARPETARALGGLEQNVSCEFAHRFQSLFGCEQAA